MKRPRRKSDRSVRSGRLGGDVVRKLHTSVHMDRRLSMVLAVAVSLASSARAQSSRTTETSNRALMPEPRLLEKAIDKLEERMGDDGQPKDGVSISTGRMVTGAGFISLGPAYRRHVFGGRAVLGASTALSNRLYTTAQIALEFPYLAKNRLKLGIQEHFQDALQVNYFGLGRESRQIDRSGYRLTTSDTGGYAILGSSRLALTGRLAWLRPARISAMSGRRPDYPDTVARFEEAMAPGILVRRSYLHGDVSLVRDTRDNTGHPERGGFYQTAWSTFVDDQDGRGNFQRVEIEGVRYMPIVSGLLTLALHGSLVGTLAPSYHVIPIFLLPNLGGRNLRGYADYRFHDRAVQSYSVESRVAMMRHVDLAVFTDIGGVAHRLRDLNRRDLKASYGVGIRLHSSRSTFARLDVSRGAEGWRVFFKMNDPFRRASQVAGRPPVVPYVP